MNRAVIGKDNVTISGAKAAGHQFSSGAGGVVHADLTDGRSLIIKDSRFSDNLVTEKSGTAGGAALFVRGDAPVTLSNVEFSNNAVNAANSRGGAIYEVPPAAWPPRRGPGRRAGLRETVARLFPQTSRRRV